MSLARYFRFNKKLNIKQEEHITIVSLFDKLKNNNSIKLDYSYVIKDEFRAEISPKIIWGGFDNVHLKIEINKNIAKITSDINSTVIMIIGLSLFMFFIFTYQSIEEDIPIWFFPLLVFLPIYFQFVLYWQLNKLFKRFKRSLENNNLLEAQIIEYT